MNRQDPIDELRRLAEQSAEPIAILEVVERELGGAPMPVIMVLREAFGASIPLAMELASWRGFPGCQAPDAEINAVFLEVLRAWREGNTSHG